MIYDNPKIESNKTRGQTEPPVKQMIEEMRVYH